MTDEEGNPEKVYLRTSSTEPEPYLIGSEELQERLKDHTSTQIEGKLETDIIGIYSKLSGEKFPGIPSIEILKENGFKDIRLSTYKTLDLKTISKRVENALLDIKEAKEITEERKRTERRKKENRKKKNRNKSNECFL